MKTSYRIYTVEEVKTGNLILSGRDHFIGNDEKARNNLIIHIEFPYTVGNYRLFYAGPTQRLISACDSIVNIHAGRGTENDYKTLVQNLHIVHHRNGKKRTTKLDGINSISTACADNCYCEEYKKDPNKICSHCYADSQQKIQLALQDRNTVNGIILRNVIIPAEYFRKYIPESEIAGELGKFRLESFGDAANKTQCINYLHLVKAFPEYTFAPWTKNNGLYDFAMMETGCPENFVYNVSSFYLNKADTYKAKNNSRIDHVFTVYEPDYIDKNNIEITCGGKSCRQCIECGIGCYFRKSDENPLEVREALK